MPTIPSPSRNLRDEPIFVVLDGIDGCGKTTQAKRLVSTLRELRTADRPDPLHLREPGSTVAGERIRELVLDPSVSMGGGSLALLFAAARRETLEQLVAPALLAGQDVVIERFHASTFAYQGSSAGRAPVNAPSRFSDDELLALLRGWAGWPAPALEIVLDIEPEASFRRALARTGGGSDRFESRGLEFQERVARGMRRYVDLVTEAVLVDAAGDEHEVGERVLAHVLALENTGHSPAESRRA